MEPSHVHAGRRRALSAMAAVCVVLAALGVAFFQLQIVRSPASVVRSAGERLQAVPVPAPRGMIVDRHGRVLAEDVAAYALSVLPAPVDSVHALLKRLSPHLGLSARDVEALLARRLIDPDRPLLVSRDVPFDAVTAIGEEMASFDGVWVGQRPQRRYPAGPAAAHVVGMLGEASSSELRRPEFRASRTGALVGRVGAERAHERRLAGVGGLRYVRVDSAGRVLGPVPTHPTLAATAGTSVQLSVDLSLQQHIAGLVAPEARVGIVALAPSSGEVLALYSSPSFDPNLPASVVREDPWGAWQDDPARPLLNRAIGAAYSPGFLWAATTAAAALRLGIVEEDTRPPLACRGGIAYGDRYFRCSDPRGHGSLGLHEALQQSCDVYFYQLALQISFERLVAAGARAGFGRVTGIDLPGEHPGTLPASPGARTRDADAGSVAAALDLATGRGPVAVSALQLARFYGALATGRGVPSPRVARGEGGGVDEARSLSLELGSAGRAWVREGLRGPTRARGVAFEPRLADWDWGATGGTVSGSTGTGHEWFVGLGGRGEIPEIVVVVVLERGRDGMDAGRVAAGAVAHYLSGGRVGSMADGS